MAKLKPEEVRAYSSQLTPGVQAFLTLLETAWVPLNAVHREPWHDLATDELCWGKHPSGDALVRLGNIRVREGYGWVRELGDPMEGSSTPEEALTREWANSSSRELQVTLSEAVQVSQGVQAVQANSTQWSHSWGLGASLKTTVSTKISAGVKAGVFSGSAEASASLEACINATYSGSTGGSSSTTDTRSENSTVTRTVDQAFTVAPWTRLRVTALAQRQTLVVPYTDQLPVDCAFKCPPFGDNAYDYASFWRSGARFQGDSLVNWLDGFFGAKTADAFEAALDLNFPWNDRAAEVGRQATALKSSPILSVQRTGMVSWARAQGFEFDLRETPLQRPG